MCLIAQRVLVVVLALSSCVQLVQADATQRAAEIDRKLATLQQDIELLKRFGAVSNAARIKEKQAQIETLQKEKSGLSGDLKTERLGRMDKRLIKSEDETGKQFASALEDLRFMTDGQAKSAANMPEQAKLESLQKAYLAIVTNRIFAEPRSSYKRMTAIRGEAQTAFSAAQTALLKELDATTQSGLSNYEVIERRSKAEAAYRLARLKYLAAEMADLTLDRGGNKQTRALLENLKEAIATNDPNNFRPPSDGHAKESHKWFRQLKREVDLETFRHYAAHAPVFDEGELVTGKTRQEIAYYSELALAERVKAAATTMPISRLFWPADTRVDLAEKIKAEALSNPDHVIFGYLQTGVEPSPRMYMLAVMRALRFEQQKINDWLVNAYSQSWYNTGLGTLIRASDGLGTGEASFTEVKRRIDRYNKQVDAVHDAFKRATETDDPEDLSQDDQDLLSAFGYVVKDLDSGLSYAVPKEGNIRGLTASAQRGLKLPGAAVLDVVTPKNVAVTVVSTVVPGGFATMIEGMAIRAGASAYTIMGVKVIAEMGAGIAIDSAVQYGESGKVDMEAIFLDSLLLGGVLEGANRVAGRSAQQMAKQLAEFEADNVLARILRDEAVQKKAAAWLEETLGLASEAAITTLYEEQFKGNNVDFNIFLSNLVNSALTRSVSATDAVIKEGEFISSESFRQRVENNVEWLKSFVREDPNLMRQMHHISAAQYKLQQEALGRYREALGESDPTASRLFDALLAGDISWLDLTIAYQKDTAEMEPLMYGVKELRDNFFDKVKVDALRMTRKELRAEFKDKLAEIDAMRLPAAEREAKAKQAFDEYIHDSRYLAEKIIAPGSNSPVSDIDRSMQHPKLRKLMERMYEVRGADQNDGGYVPTSARAFDVNEYYNVMPFISETNQLRQIIDPLPVEGGLKHGDIMESFGYAAAMMHMNPVQKARYQLNERNALSKRLKGMGIKKGSARYDARIAKFEQLFDRARKDLDRGKSELHAKIKALGLSRKDPEAELRARSALYQERISAYYEQLKKLDKLKNDGTPAEQHQLRAEIEREMAYFLREGIETYSGSATLDIVVVQMQIAKLKIGPALLDPSFTLMEDLNNLRREDIDFMVRDQCLMMVEHINGYYDGHELPYNSGKALAKYAQRALLALKIKGDINIKRLVDNKQFGDPVYKLYDMTNKLMKQKPNPAGFNEVLSSFTTKGDPDSGLQELMKVIEQVVPQMEKMSSVDNFDHLSGVRPGNKNPYLTNGHFQYVRIVRKRQEAALAQQVGDYGGGYVLKQYLESQRTEMEQMLDEIKKRYERFASVYREYDVTDWPEVLRLKKAIRGCDLVLHNVPGTSPKMQKSVFKPKREMEARLRELLLPKELHSDPSAFSLQGRLWLQIQFLTLLLTENKAAIIEADKQVEQEKLFEKINLSGVWEFRRGDQKGRAKIEQRGRRLKMWVTSDTMSSKPPHFAVEGVFHRGQIRAYWEELHSQKLKTVDAPASDWNERGLFFAEVAMDRSYITTSARCTELSAIEENQWLWSGLTFRPAAEGVRAATDLKILSAEKHAMKQETAELNEPKKTRSAQGLLWVTQFNASGTAATRNFEVYSVGTYGTSQPDLITRSRTFREVDMVPGAYELVVKMGAKIHRQPISIGVGGITKIRLPQMGSMRFRMVDHTGKSFVQNRVQLRVFQKSKPIAWCSETPINLDPGTYDAVVYVDSGPIGDGQSYRMQVEISAQEETRIIGRFGALELKVTDADGKPASEGVYPEVHFKNPDGSLGSAARAESNAKTQLLPGAYEVALRLKNGAVHRETLTITPAEMESRSYSLGRLKISYKGKPLPKDNSLHPVIKSKANAHDYIHAYDSSVFDVFPGIYTVSLFDTKGKGLISEETVTVRAGRTTTLKLK